MKRRILLIGLLTTAVLSSPVAVRGENDVFRIGMIGLDTSHVIAFTRDIHNPDNNYGCRVVVGYPGGSPDIESSASRVGEYTKQLREEFGVEMTDSIEELCGKVDGVMLMSVDGRPHLEQIKPVIAARKPVYIDKPMAGNLADVIEIFRLAKQNNVPCWSSSSLRYCPSIIGMRSNDEVGEVLGCDAFSPCYLEEHHPDLYWYGVHGVETLYTIMGPGCDTVRRLQTKDTEFVVGLWEDGRIGTFRGLRGGKRDYGALVYGTKGIVPSGKFTGYSPLVEEIIKFFKTGKVPVPPEETIEIFAFMTAADESKARGGAPVSIESVIEKAKNKCSRKGTEMKFTGAEGEVKLMTLDPGHFHAALIQKTMYDQVSPTVHVYAPKGPDVDDHLKRIDGFNNRSEDPTGWQERIYTGDYFLEKMLQEKPGNVVVLSGNNKKKAEYIKACVQAGLNVLADKPMCIDGDGFELLKEAFELAEENGVMIYDIMTERSEITTILQKELVQNSDVFGRLKEGSVDNPSVVKESVHHFFKYVSGNPIKRPPWYFDTTQQGEGIVDVTTHLLDLVMWESFPGETVDYQKDIEIKKARRWPTEVSREQFKKVTRLNDFPDFLKRNLNDEGLLPCYANGEIIFTLKGVHAKTSVKWNFQAPEGAGDTHYSIMKGTKANVIIRQGKEQDYRPELYVEPAERADKRQLAKALRAAIAELQSDFPGLELKREAEMWHVLIPGKYRIGHEAHFRQVTERYLKYLVDGKLPDWEVPNMIAKYRTTTEALEMAAAATCSPQPKVKFVPGDNKIDVMIGGRHFTSYMYGDDLTKPVLFPVHTPSGIVVNRGYPLAPAEGESTDHPHHVGIFFTYDRVNDDGFWNNTTSPPQIKHVKVTEMTAGAGEGELAIIANWVGKSGQVLLQEERSMVFRPGENEYAIDFSIDLTARDTEVVFEDTKEGMFAIRVAHWLRENETGQYLSSSGGRMEENVWGRRARWVRLEGEKDGKTIGIAIRVAHWLRESETGQYLSSSGGRTEENVWGRRARWVRLEGEKDGKTIGIAIFNHPASVNYPTYWHARGYGLFAANPLGQFVFDESRRQANPQPFQLTLQPGRTAHFGFRLLVYEGPRTRKQLEQRFDTFAQ